MYHQKPFKQDVMWSSIVGSARKPHNSGDDKNIVKPSNKTPKREEIAKDVKPAVISDNAISRSIYAKHNKDDIKHIRFAVIDDDGKIRKERIEYVPYCRHQILCHLLAKNKMLYWCDTKVLAEVVDEISSSQTVNSDYGACGDYTWCNNMHKENGISNRHYTIECNAYKTGSCTRGKCYFVHNYGSLEVCKDFLKGKCKKSVKECPRRHYKNDISELIVNEYDDNDQNAFGDIPTTVTDVVTKPPTSVESLEKINDCSDDHSNDRRTSSYNSIMSVDNIREVKDRIKRLEEERDGILSGLATSKRGILDDIKGYGANVMSIIQKIENDCADNLETCANDISTGDYLKNGTKINKAEYVKNINHYIDHIDNMMNLFYIMRDSNYKRVVDINRRLELLNDAVSPRINKTCGEQQSSDCTNEYAKRIEMYINNYKSKETIHELFGDVLNETDIVKITEELYDYLDLCTNDKTMDYCKKIKDDYNNPLIADIALHIVSNSDDKSENNTGDVLLKRFKELLMLYVDNNGDDDTYEVNDAGESNASGDNNDIKSN